MKKLSVNISDDLHRNFKAACAIAGEEMTSVILRMIEKYVKDAGTKTKSK